jgi:hypothetical protein
MPSDEPPRPAPGEPLPATLTLTARNGRAEEHRPQTRPPPEKSAPRSLSERLMRGLLDHGLGYIAATQQLYAVGGHFGWVMLVIIGLQGGGTGSMMNEVSRGLLLFYAALGGVDETGRGGTSEMMEVWGKVSLIIYLVEVLFSRVRGARQPWSLKRKWAASTLLACAGYALAFALMSMSNVRGTGDMLGVIPFFVIFTSVMTWWALAIGKFMRFMQQQVRGESPQPKPQ